jgi:hypothetical protein
MGNPIPDLILFLYTILCYWQGLISGGLVTAAVVLFERLTKYHLKKRAYVGLFVCGFLFVSCFLAWRDEHRRAMNLAFDTVRLKATIEAMSIGSAPMVGSTTPEHQPDMQSYLMITASIRNAGAESIAELFTLSAVFPNGEGGKGSSQSYPTSGP